MLEQFLILIPCFPLIGFLLISLGINQWSKSAVSFLACSTVALSFLMSICIFLHVESHGAITQHIFDWFHITGFNIGFDLLADPLSLIFCLVITGVGLLIHIYSIGYMHDDPRFNHFLSYLNLFVFFMLLLVLGANYLVLFVGWEGVGLCSYLLIGFWFTNTEYNNAARKAFIINRIGDLGLIIGLFMIYVNFGSLDYNIVCQSGQAMAIASSTLTAITLLLFVGAAGKSAQIPLYTWLPDAMAGPTPVSALIHAATMVTAGVYLVVRSNVLFSLAPISQFVVMIVGLITCIMAASIGFKQYDIKKILAYSTVSQLGLMFFALGLGAYTAAVFHVVTHAFFKALLFLGAGSVIHALHHEQDIRQMGGLKTKLKITYTTMLIATLAISGFPLLSGFFSKDEILANAYAHTPWLWICGLIASLMTACYMFRMLFVTFWGKYNNTHFEYDKIHESPKSMTMPLVILAVLSVVGGIINIPHALGGNNWLQHWLKSVINENLINSHSLSHEVEYMLMTITSVLVLVIIYLVYQYYVVKNNKPSEVDNGYQKVIANKYYIDEIYNTIFVKPIGAISNFLHQIFELKWLDASFEGLAKLSNLSGAGLRTLQSGRLDYYIMSMTIALIFLIWVLFGK